MFKWSIEKHGRIYESEDNQLFIVGWHQFALYYWAKAVAENRIKSGTLLLHVDYHSDHLNDSATDNIFFSSPDEIEKLIENDRIQHDSYIVPAIRWGIVKDIAFCCYYPNEDGYLGFTNYREITDLEDWLMQSNVKERDIILNIDLDYFLQPIKALNIEETPIWPPKKENIIKQEIACINRLFRMSKLTTIATSPNIGNPHREDVKRLFKKYFEIAVNLDESKLELPFF